MYYRVVSASLASLGTRMVTSTSKLEPIKAETAWPHATP